MPNISAEKTVRALGQLFTSFSTARESDSQSFLTNNTLNSVSSIQFFKDSGKGSTNYRFTRLFCVFDMSSYTSGTITNLAFNYRSSTSTTSTEPENRIVAVKFDGMGSGPSFSNYANSEFFDDIDYSTAYSATTGTIPEWPDANQDNTLSLNSTAISDAQSNGELKMAIIQFTNDYNGVDASGDVNYNFFANYSAFSSGFLPFLSFDHATGYGNTVNGVISGNIGKIDAVATGNIDKVIGVS
tara:strand:+ start:441 stop:1166 length:726 start_codon:yes stop_codon:yes gene_type:complete